MEDNTQVDKIHSLVLKVAIEIKRICEENGITYFLTAGSVLGAVRHGGFIPWDDDMDIGMLRSDYERFIEVCKTELTDEFFLQTWDTDEEYPFSFAKIRLNNTVMVEEFSKNVGMHNGIFVDIFPFDNVPNNILSRKLQSYKYFMCKRILWIKKGMGKGIISESRRSAFKYYLFLLISKFFSYKKTKEYFKRIQKKYNAEKSDYVVTDGSYSFNKETIKRIWIEELEPIKFDKYEFMTYKKKIDYLSYFYGDYMVLPPLEKRKRHKLLMVDFGPYNDINSNL